MGKRKHAKNNIKPRVLLVEDDDAIVTMVKYNLEKQGFDVNYTHNGEEALLLIEENRPDILLLDWMLPGLTGVEICNRLRRQEHNKKIPIIMISARGEEGDKIEGLDRGADDYLVKPFSPRELVARINAVFRRIRPAFTAKELEFGCVSMNLAEKKVLRRGKEIHLGPTEYRLLQAFMEYPRRVLSREQLMRRVWGCDLHVELRTVDVHINRLRKSLELDGTGTVIKTVRSSGYCLKFIEDDDSDLDQVLDSEVPDLEEIEEIAQNDG